MPRLFGTDGVRGLANGDLTPQLAMRLAMASANVLREADKGPLDGALTGAVLAVVGRDPRASGEMLEAGVVAGLTSAGVSVLRVGVLPTPGVAFLTAEFSALLGVVLSASHNPMPDNGVKIFGRGGHKLDDGVEDEIESRLFEEWDRPTGEDVGRVTDLHDAQERYLAHLRANVSHRLDGLTVVVDCANGAASHIAPQAYREAGARVIALHCEPDGFNINAGCGSTHLGPLQEAVVAHHADLGIAHDGDADRCLAVDARGQIVDGDAILVVCAEALLEAGELPGAAVATTVMTNVGVTTALEKLGITVHQTPVGDRYLLAVMREHGLALGGEQSGHLVFSRYATTGDGVLTALQLMGRVASSGRPLAQLTAVVERLPQVLVNVSVPRGRDVIDVAAVRASMTDAQAALGARGRILLRPSGTEPLVRVMVEASSHEVARHWAEAVAAAVTAAATTSPGPD